MIYQEYSISNHLHLFQYINQHNQYLLLGQNLVLTLVVAIFGCDIGWDGIPNAYPALALAFYDEIYLIGAPLP